MDANGRPTTAREVLDIIEDFGARAKKEADYGVTPTGTNTGTNSRLHSEARKLGEILSALRGPDSGDFEVKRKTTMVLRGAALPIFSDFVGMAKVGASQTEVEAARDETTRAIQAGEVDYHFYQHVNRGLKALLS